MDVARDGAPFKFVKNAPLLSEAAGGDFRPMELYVAADGSLLVSDWGYGGWKSPKAVGTVWRVTWPEAKPAARLKDESDAGTSELIAALDHPDRDQRLRAEWALVRRGEAALGSLTLRHTSADPVVDEIIAVTLAPMVETLHRTSGSDVQRAHALWTLDLLGDASPELRARASGLIRQVLTDPSAAILAP